MRISFDLDDTLICYLPGVPCEPSRVPWLFRWMGNEPLRRQAVALLRELSAAGHELWVYTTSYRCPTSVRWWLWWYGVSVRRVINQTLHERHIGRGGPSKNPSHYRIDLHIDDSWGVWIEGKRHGFRVMVVEPEDLEWADRIRQAVAMVLDGKNPPTPQMPDWESARSS